MSVFEDIMAGLTEALSIVKGESEGNIRCVSIKPLESMSPEGIRAVRESLGMSRRLFAETMGVSKKTVEAWEAGRHKPKGSALKMLALLKDDPDFARKMSVLAV